VPDTPLQDKKTVLQILESLGDHLKAAIRYHFKTGHREAA
jgi:hypothetical protein